MPELRNVKSDFFFMRRPNEEGVAQLIKDLCTTRLPKNMGIPADQIQVLSPTRKGGVGTMSLNKMLQEALNPASADKKERQFGEFTFREGDRVGKYDCTPVRNISKRLTNLLPLPFRKFEQVNIVHMNEGML